MNTSNDELRQLVKDGHFFQFCLAFAVNIGYRDAIKEKKEVTFTVGDYEVKFDHKRMLFDLSHKVYVARVIHAYYQEVVFVGDNEDEVIGDLLAELEKEIATPSNETIKVCEHDKKTPLIWTFKFDGFEYWCPVCGYKGGMFGAGINVPLTELLKKAKEEWEEKAWAYLNEESIIWKYEDN